MRVLRRIAFLGLLGCSVAAAGGESTVELPDPATGEISGEPALLMWPRLDGELIEPKNCLVSLQRPNDEPLVFPCGTWFLPPEGRHIAFIDGPGYVSPFPQVFFYRKAPFAGSGKLVSAQVVDAFTARLAPEIHLRPGLSLRLLSLDRGAFVRRTAHEESRRGVNVPAGTIVAGIFDNDDNAIALTKPLSVRKGEEIELRPVSSRKGADVLAVLRVDSASTDVLLTDGRGQTHEPAAKVVSHGRVYAIWYGVGSGQGTVTVDGERRIPVSLDDQRVTTVRD